MKVQTKRAHDAFINHIMQRSNCCAAMHGRYCAEGRRLKDRHETRFWTGYVLDGDCVQARRQRLMGVPERYKATVTRMARYAYERRAA